MVRPLRIEYPGAWYHAMNRGASRCKVFLDKKDYNLFLTVLKEACNLFNVFISSYCLMPTHYHILVFTPEGNLSRFMRHLNGVYTQRYNRKHEKDGPLFRGRYKAVLVQEEGYLTGVVRYIHRNPIKAKMANEIKDYKWSSHGVYLNGRSKEDWLNIDPVLLNFSKKRKHALLIYNEYMEQESNDEVEKFYSRKNLSSILGDNYFINKMKERFIYSDKKLDIEIIEKKKIQGEGRIEKINIEVCKVFGVLEDKLYKSRKGEENVPRLMAVFLSRELSGFQFPEIAKKYNISSYRTVGTFCYRFNEKLKKNKKLTRQYKKIKSRCSQEWT